MINNEVTLSRKNCKINTSQHLFRGLVVDTTITEITQEEFDEYLITNIISLDNKRKDS